MKDKNKIPFDTLRDRLQAAMKYSDPRGCIKVLFDCWVLARKLPKTCKQLGCRPPERHTIQTRRRIDGYVWLKPAEARSFEAYVGVKLL